MTDTLGFLISDVSRLMRRRFDERARRMGATRAQWKALVTLSRHEGINQGGLADLLEVEPITLCRMVDRLEEAGLVERRRDPTDRRAWQMFLTEASRPVLEKLRLYSEEMFEMAFAGLDTRDRDRLSTALERVRDNLLAADLAPHPAREIAHG